MGWLAKKKTGSHEASRRKPTNGHVCDTGREDVIGQEDWSFANMEFLHIGRHDRRDFIGGLHTEILASL